MPSSFAPISHKGRIVKTTGDGILMGFASVVDAETRAVAAAERNGIFIPKITFRIGINIGGVIIDGDNNRERDSLAPRPPH